MHNLRSRAAMGFCVKSGWSAVVLLVGPVPSPGVLHNGIVELSDPSVPETKQPYHAGTGALETDEAKVAGRVRMVRACAHEAVTKLLLNYRNLDINKKETIFLPPCDRGFASPGWSV